MNTTHVVCACLVWAVGLVIVCCVGLYLITVQPCPVVTDNKRIEINHWLFDEPDLAYDLIEPYEDGQITMREYRVIRKAYADLCENHTREYVELIKRRGEQIEDAT